MTDFEPARDGFAFRNSWRFDDRERQVIRSLAEDASRDALRMLAPNRGSLLDRLGVDEAIGRLASSTLPDSYGLCGGMAFAALDYFKSDAEIPRGAGPDDIPTRSTPEGAALRSYLWDRLIDSLEENLATFLAWMAMLHLVPSGWPFRGGRAWVLDESRSEWSALKEHLDAGEPRPLGLVGATRDPFNNHQVLACGYEEKSTSGTIHLYDMNCPGRTSHIHVGLERGALVSLDAETCASRNRGRLMGFFCERYTPRSPNL